MQVGQITEIETALSACGVTEMTLTATEKDSLDKQGYVVLPNVMDSAWLAKLQTAFEQTHAQAKPATSGKQSGTRHTGDLVYKDPGFEAVLTNPKLLASAYYILRRSFKLFQLHGRDPLPGYGLQGLHTDWYQRAPKEPFNFVTALWMLDDFTPHNGATRLIPGSHLHHNPLHKSLQQPEARHPDQKLISASAGSVLVFNGHLWHSGTRNESNRSRRALQCQFVARELVRPNEEQREAAEWLGPAARFFLGL